MILEPIWQLYDAALEEHDAQRTAEMAAALNIEVPPRELKSTELRGLLQSGMCCNLYLKYVLQVVDVGRNGSGAEHRGTSQGAQVYGAAGAAAIGYVYLECVLQVLVSMLAEMAAALNIEMPPRELKSTELRGLLQSVMKRWLPVADAVLRMVVELGPSPLKAQGARMAALWPRDGALKLQAGGLQLQPEGTVPLPTGLTSAPPSAVNTGGRKQLPEQEVGKPEMDAAQKPEDSAAVSLEQAMASVRNAIATCATTADAPVVLFVSKMVPVRSTELLDLTDGSEQLTFVAFARIFSGTITPTSKLHILGPKYHPLRPGQNRHVSTLGGPGEGDAGGSAPLALYMMMGTGLHPVPSVAAGNVLAVAGLESQVQKCATLSSTLACPALTAISLQAKPMVRVAVEAHHQKDMQASLPHHFSVVMLGIEYIAVSVNDRGEHIVCCLGELHLEQCLKDLREQYARVEVRVSPPLVSFRETVLAPGTLDRDGSIVNAGEIVRPGQMSIPPWSEEEALQAANFRTGRVRCVIASGEVALTVRCSPLPLPVARLLDESPESVRALAVQLAAERQHAVLSTDGIDSGSGTEGTRPCQQLSLCRLKSVVFRRA
ncbi:hypothetical protein JKP88DRAFT_251342 [Tribonema minus]|uniref:Uncharacterized protein n=1 Tax=Tribonema minus TaxID=303371 RepID=A0A836CNB0_9STRA|nr:hypothetical protein JKP88DRAFT_251342 [Tribonema minus]